MLTGRLEGIPGDAAVVDLFAVRTFASPGPETFQAQSMFHDGVRAMIL